MPWAAFSTETCRKKHVKVQKLLPTEWSSSYMGESFNQFCIAMEQKNDNTFMYSLTHHTSRGCAVAARGDEVVQAVDASERGNALRHFQRRVDHSVGYSTEAF